MINPPKPEDTVDSWSYRTAALNDAQDIHDELMMEIAPENVGGRPGYTKFIACKLLYHVKYDE